MTRTEAKFEATSICTRTETSSQVFENECLEDERIPSLISRKEVLSVKCTRKEIVPLRKYLHIQSIMERVSEWRILCELPLENRENSTFDPETGYIFWTISGQRRHK